MSKQTYGIDSKTVDRWKKGFQKKKNDILLIPTIPAPQVPPVVTPITNAPTDLSKAFESLFASDPNQITKRDNDVWKITFPKMAQDLIEPAEFKENVMNAVLLFIKINFPLDVELAKDIKFKAECVHVETDEYNYYPNITLKPEISGPSAALEEFLKPISQWNGYEMYWKGSFLRSKTTGKITGMRLTGLSYNVPDKYIHGQPISYVEKTVI